MDTLVPYQATMEALEDPMYEGPAARGVEPHRALGLFHAPDLQDGLHKEPLWAGRVGLQGGRREHPVRRYQCRYRLAGRRSERGGAGVSRSDTRLRISRDKLVGVVVALQRTKLGKANVKMIGEFDNRNGTTSITVTR